MSKKVQISNEEHTLPLQGENPAWGEDLSDLIQALIDAVNNVVGPNDILETSASIQNLGTFPANIPNLYYDPTSVKSFETTYNLSRNITKAISATSGDGSIVTVTTTGNHYLFEGNQVVIDSIIPELNGTKTVLSVVSPTQFTIMSTYLGNDATSTFNVELSESGTIYGNYGQQGWSTSRTQVGDARVDLDILSSGQFIYTPETLVGTNYSGLAKFLGKAVLKS